MPHHHYAQTASNSCGASTLLCAALELGTVEIPAQPQWPLWSATIPLETNLRCELTIYSVTSGNGGLPPGPNAGYSLPSHLYEAARALGRQATGYVPSSLVGMLLTTFYAADVERARGLGMLIHAQAPPAPMPDQRLLRVMRVGADVLWQPATGLHYILERPDGSVMDPALGQTANNLSALQRYQSEHGVAYVDTGIGIMIS